MNRNISEPMKEATTPEEMRAEIARLEHYDPLVRNVMSTANYRGLSAEDRYTMLAYYALQIKIDVQAQMLEFVKNSAIPSIFITSPKEKTTETF